MAWTITGSSVSMPSTPISSRSPSRAGPTRIVKSSSSRHCTIGLRTAWCMSSSAIPCFRAVCPMRTVTRYFVRAGLSRNLVGCAPDQVGPRDRKQTAEGTKTALESQPEPLAPIVLEKREQPRTRANGPESAEDGGGGIRGVSGMFVGIGAAEGPQKRAKRTAKGPQGQTPWEQLSEGLMHRVDGSLLRESPCRARPRRRVSRAWLVMASAKQAQADPRQTTVLRRARCPECSRWATRGDEGGPKATQRLRDHALRQRIRCGVHGSALEAAGRRWLLRSSVR
jgi:hypothetical protein